MEKPVRNVLNTPLWGGKSLEIYNLRVSWKKNRNENKWEMYQNSQDSGIYGAHTIIIGLNLKVQTREKTDVDGWIVEVHIQITYLYLTNTKF